MADVEVLFELCYYCSRGLEIRHASNYEHLFLRERNKVAPLNSLLRLRSRGRGSSRRQTLEYRLYNCGTRGSSRSVNIILPPKPAASCTLPFKSRKNNADAIFDRGDMWVVGRRFLARFQAICVTCLSRSLSGHCSCF